MISLPQEYFSVDKTLLREARALISNNENLEELLKISNPLHPLGKVVATALFLVIKKFQSQAKQSFDFISDIQKYWIPLANNFGMWKTRYFLEDALFAMLDKKNYSLILSLIKKKRHVQEKLFEDISAIVSHHLEKKSLKDFEIVCRQKNIFGIYEKSLRKKKNINHVTDFFAFRIIVDKKEDCDRALGVLHQLWPHYADRFKDYIKNPKPNYYQSIHTTLFCLDCNVAEFQIRTREMDYIAKYGAANHALYKNFSALD